MNKYTKTECNLLFKDSEVRGYRWVIFEQTELGKIYSSIPFAELSQLLTPKARNSIGAPSWFDSEGMFAILFLKAYLGLSDRKLIDRINSDWELQMFCGKQFPENERIKDRNLPSRIRSYIGNNLCLEQFQSVIIENWQPYIDNTHCGMADATVYESYIKYPTDEKLLWDCCIWVYESTHELCKELRIKRPRSKYNEQKTKQLSYSKTKKKSYKLKSNRRKSLLNLLTKGIDNLSELIDTLGLHIDISTLLSIEGKLKIVSTIYEQQKFMHENPGEYSKDRIVSLFKTYLRPIVRGKENKRVEFGAKVHSYQVDGINLIDKLSFDAFNEAKLLKGCVEKHKNYFGEITQLGVDRIYGTNENRKLLTDEKITTCLPRKGKAPKDEEQVRELRSQIGKQRATAMEGSFGNEKNHYGLRKIKARTQETEVVWILFGIMTANAVKISKRKFAAKKAA